MNPGDTVFIVENKCDILPGPFNVLVWGNGEIY